MNYFFVNCFCISTFTIKHVFLCPGYLKLDIGYWKFETTVARNLGCTA